MANWKEICPDFTEGLQKEWESKEFNYQQTKEWIDIGLGVKEADLAGWLRDIKGFDSEWVLNYLKVEDLRQEFQEELEKGDKNETINAQVWLDKNYPTPEDKANCQELNIFGYHEQFSPQGGKDKLTSSLSLKGFVNLERLDCSFNELTKLDLSACYKLEELSCSGNLLTSLDLSNNKQLKKFFVAYNQLTSFDYSTLNPEQLTHLSIMNNCLTTQNLLVFSRFANLEALYIGNKGSDKGNHFTGFLSSLAPCSKLQTLHIPNLEITGSVTDLPDSIKTVICSPLTKNSIITQQLVNNPEFFFAEDGDGYQVYKDKNKEIDWSWIHPGFVEMTLHPRLLRTLTYQLLWERAGFSREEAQEWVATGLTPQEYEKVVFLRHQGYRTQLLTKDQVTQLRKADHPAQAWLDCFYPINGYCLRLGHDYGDKTRAEITELDCSKQHLSGSLTLTGFSNLEKLNLDRNKLTSLDVSRCPKLTWLEMDHNRLTELPRLTSPQQLIKLDISYNNLTDSLIYLQGMSRLEWLNVSHTQIVSGLEYLPVSLKIIYCDDCPLAKQLVDYKEGTSYNYQAWLKTNPHLENLNRLDIKSVINWQENNYLFKNFTEKLTQKWINHDFNKSEARKWLESNLKITEANFAQWLRDTKKVDAKWLLDQGDEEELRKEFQKYLSEKSNNNQENKQPLLGKESDEKSLEEQHKNKVNWKEDIYPFKNFTEEITQEWINCGFNKKETRDWLEDGLLQPNDAKFAQWVKYFKKMDGKQFSDYGREEEIRGECQSCLKLEKFWHLNNEEEGSKITKSSISSTVTVEGGVIISVPLTLHTSSAVTCYKCKKNFQGQYLSGGYDDRNREVYICSEKCLQDHNFQKSEVITAWNFLTFDKRNLQIPDFPTWEELIEKQKSGELKTFVQQKLEETKQVRKSKLTNNFAQRWLEENYPDKTITTLDISNKDLEGDLDLSSFPELVDLKCWNNKLISLSLAKNCKLTTIDCSDNLLANITLPASPTNLKILDLSSNNFPKQNLSFLAKATRLEELYLGNRDSEKIKQGTHNKFTGPLNYLSGMENLKYFGYVRVDYNDYNADDKVDNYNTSNKHYEDDLFLDNLPGLKYISHSSWEKPTSKLIEFVRQLNEYKFVEFVSQLEEKHWKEIHNDFTWESRRKWEKWGFSKEQTKGWLEAGAEREDDFYFVIYLRDVKRVTPEWVANNKEEFQELKKCFHKHGWCRKCWRINTNENWCQPCTEREWQEDIKQLTGQELVDKFIQYQQSRTADWEKMLGWIPCEQLADVRYLAEGGFSKVYRACWDGWSVTKNELYGWPTKKNHQRTYSKYVALKILNNSQSVTPEFLTEIANAELVGGSESVVRCCGISQAPDSGNYIMVMDYMEDGNLRQYLQRKGKELGFKDKLKKLHDIASKLHRVHEKDLVHKDFHPGNILLSYSSCCIADLGLCRPASSQFKEGGVYGILPYVAPEVLQDQPYTKASDIYSFGIVAYELLANSYPYYDLSLNDNVLASKICQGLRPNIDNLKIPQLLKDLIKRCWDADPEQRPTTSVLDKVASGYYYGRKEDEREEISGCSYHKKDFEFIRQREEIESEYNQWSQNTPYRIHPNTVTASKPINSEKISKLVRNLPKSSFQSTKSLERISGELGSLKESLAGKEVVNLFEEFIQARKNMIKNKKDKEVKNKVKELDKKMKENGLTKEKIEEIVRYCEKLVNLEQQLEQEQLQAQIEINANK